MNIEQAHILYTAMKQTPLTSLLDNLMQSAVCYARIRADWQLATDEQRRDMDAARTRCHDAFIDCCNILSRNMLAAGEDNQWRNELGNDRKAIGDFACLLHCLLGLQAR